MPTNAEVVAAYNVMVTALQKGQGNGAFSLQEAGEILVAIRTMKPLIEALDSNSVSLSSILSES
jgi:hypothetical protein